MTKNPVYALPHDTVAEVARLMKDKDIGPVPIVQDRDGTQLVGIVTDRDLALKVVAEGLDPMTTRVSDVMTSDPVVDKENRLVGIIAQADVATRMNEPEKTAEVVKEISE
jgi:CBS domain-containing protein